MSKKKGKKKNNSNQNKQKNQNQQNNNNSAKEQKIENNSAVKNDVKKEETNKEITKEKTELKNNFVEEKKTNPTGEIKNNNTNNTGKKKKHKKTNNANKQIENKEEKQENKQKQPVEEKSTEKKEPIVVFEQQNNKEKNKENKEESNSINKENKKEKKKQEKLEKKEKKKADVAYKTETKKKKKGIAIAVIVLLVLILIALGIFTIPALLTRNNDKIVEGVSVNGINLQGLTYEEAKEKLNSQAAEIVESDIRIVMGEYENDIKLSQISTKYNVDKAIEEAHNIGRENNILKSSYDVLSAKQKGKDIDIDIEFNQDEVKNVFNNISQELPGHVIQWDYSIENGKTLIVTKGKPGIVIDEDETQNRLKEALVKALKGEEIGTIELAIKEVEPDPIDVDVLHEKVFKEPQNAYVTQDPFAVYVHVDGVDFDVDEVKQLVQSDDEEYEIELTITPPEITTKDLGEEAFPDVLGRTYKTTYSAGDVSRNTNIEIAARTVNGTILMPGETFSYNGILGDTTAAKGYKPAGAYLNGQVIQSYGGGICQVSSTIYNAALYADLQIDERYNHSYPSGYVPNGLDATVSYGSKDFKFTNNRKYPIKLECTAGGGVITATFYGVKQDDDVEVKLQSVDIGSVAPKVVYENTNTLAAGEEKVKQKGSYGVKTQVYISKYRDGEEISNELLHTDVYSAKPKIILRGTKKTD